MSFFREDVKRMLDAGWSKEDVLITAKATEAFMGYPVTAVLDWGIVLGDQDSDVAFVAYRGSKKERGGWGRTPAVCYTDGSGTTREKPAGIGVYVECGDRTKLIAENIGNGTNNVAELTAIWRAMREFSTLTHDLLIKSDSEYAIGILSNPKWLAQANDELVRRIREDLSFRRNVKFEHVDGHKGIPGNEIADSLAKVGRKYVQVVSRY